MKTFRSERKTPTNHETGSMLSAFVLVTFALPGLVMAQAGEKAPAIHLLIDKPVTETAPGIDSAAAELPEDIRQVPLEIKTGQSIEDVKYARVEVSLETEREHVNEDGTRTVENFNAEGKRTEKNIINADDALLERWLFDAAHDGRITRYETYTYGDKGLEHYRIAEWAYEDSGASMKTNRTYNAQKKQTGVSVEYKSANGTRYREEWYDAKENPVGLKLWDAETGAFREHLLIKYAAGLKKLQWLDEDGSKVREQIVHSLDGASQKGIRLGETFETDMYDNMRDRDRRRLRSPWVSMN